MQSRTNAPTPMPTSAPTERLGAPVPAGLAAAKADVGAVGELVMLICPALASVDVNGVEEGREEVVVAGLCPAPVVLKVCVLIHSSQAENPAFPMAIICVTGQRITIRHDPAMVPICARPEVPHIHAVSVRSPQALTIADETHPPIAESLHVVWAVTLRGEIRRPRRNKARERAILLRALRFCASDEELVVYVVVVALHD